jgi:pSer/pThr/pTyr-binding forkhead associated (FHA) protein
VIHIGRDPENDVVLDYPMVSGRHARIILRSGVAQIEDLGSTNGTAVGQPTTKVSQATLKPDDVVYFGSLPIPVSQLLQGQSRPAAPPVALTFRGQPIVLGRDADCDVVLDSPKVSGRHARLRQEGQQILVEDLGSTNGTFVNGQAVQRPTVVRAGDVIGLGTHSLKLEVAGG